jgi:hypothetical protein
MDTENNDNKPSAARLLNNIDNAIQAVGKDGESVFPMHLWDAGNVDNNQAAEELLNIDRILYEYLAMRRMASQSSGRIKQIKKEFPHLFDSGGAEPGGGALAVVQGSLLTMTATAKRGSTTVDTTKLVNELRKAGVDADVLKKALADATTQRAPSITYDAIITI